MRKSKRRRGKGNSKCKRNSRSRNKGKSAAGVTADDGRSDAGNRAGNPGARLFAVRPGDLPDGRDLRCDPGEGFGGRGSLLQQSGRGPGRSGGAAAGPGGGIAPLLRRAADRDRPERPVSFDGQGEAKGGSSPGGTSPLC